MWEVSPKGSFPATKGMGPPKGSRGRSESPLVASAEAKSSVIQEKEERLFPLPSTRNQFLGGRLRRGEILCDTGKERKALFPCLPQEICFLWEVSSACGRTRYFPITGKYPKGAGGGQRVHVSWPPPDPPLLSYNAPLASQGRAQLGSRPSLGGPLSPSRLAFTS